MKSNRENKFNMEKKDENFEPDVTVNEEDVKKENKSAIKEAYFITVPNLALRLGPGKEFDIIGIIGETNVEIIDKRNGFGKLADNSAWICLDYARKIN